MVSTIAASSSVFTFKHLVFYSTIITVLLMIFSNAIISSIEQNSLTPLVTELGKQFLLANKNLEENSKKVLNDDIIISNSIFKNIYNYLSVFSDFFISIFVIYLWIKLLMFIYSRSFMSQQGNWFMNFILAFLTYYILEVIFILFNEAINKNVNGLNDLTNILMLPIYSFYLFFSAIIHILVPFLRRFNKATSNLGVNEIIQNITI